MREVKYFTPTGYGQYTEGLGTLRASGGDYGGGTEVLIVSYQEITGCLSQGAHPGSYNGQDAYNDMLVVQNGILDTENWNLQEVEPKSHAEFEGLQGRNGSDYRG